MNKINLPKNFENIDENDGKKIEGGTDGDNSYTVLNEPIYTSDSFLSESTNSSSSLLSNLFSTYLTPLIRPIISSIANTLVDYFTNMINSFFGNLFT